MGRSAQTVDVDGVRYEIVPLPTDDGLELYEELVTLVGPALLKLGGDIDEKSLTEGDAVQLFLKLALRSVSSLPQGTMKRLSHTFRETCVLHVNAGGNDLTIPLTGETYDDHFSGRFRHWSAWLFACLRVNFADFLAGAGGEKTPGAAAKNQGAKASR